jgi:hypothetical protein
MSRCSGCFPIYQANQMAHMEVGGCLYVDEVEVEYCLPVNLEPQFDAAAAESESNSEASGFDSVGTECCICYEIIGKKNNCITECGHIFCFKCLATSMSRNNSCPCCRTKLIDVSDEDDDEDSDYEESQDDEDEDDDDEDEDAHINKDYEGDIEDIVSRLESEGVTMLDVVSLLVNKFSKKNEKYNTEYVKNLCMKVDQINTDVENESREKRDMFGEDKPTLDSNNQETVVKELSESMKERLGPINE